MREPRSDEAIRLGTADDQGIERKGIDWSLIRSIYMRVLGLAWIAKGLYGGAAIIGLHGPAFDKLAGTEQAILAFSTIGDCIAGVGLWLTAEWGAITWIAVTLVEAAFALTNGAATGQGFAILAPVLVYLLVAVLSARHSYARA
jgi:hypothetical protein